MMIFRCHTPDMVDLFINHPSIRPTAEQGDHRLYSASVLADPANIALVGECGMALFQGLGNGVFQGHIYVLDDHRGATGLALGRAALAMLFGPYEAVRCVAKVPLQLRSARFFVRRLGFTGLGVDHGENIEHFVMET